jgi:purine-binding chemotaxis protein CheW
VIKGEYVTTANRARDEIDDDLYEDDDDTQKDKYLTFHLENEVYGIEILHVIEIVGVQKITEVPDMPPFVKGVINLRGQVIPVVDIRPRFNMDSRDYDDRTCVVVTSINENNVGLIVDTVSEVLEIPEEAVSPPPKVASAGTGAYIQGLGKVEEQVIILLDIGKLLFDTELETLNSATAAS